MTESFPNMLYPIVIVLVNVLCFTKGDTITASPSENVLIHWTMAPIPQPSTTVTVLHPSGSVLLTALGTSVVPISNRVLDPGTTNTNTGYIAFVLHYIAMEDAGNYSADYHTASNHIIRPGVTLVVTGHKAYAKPGEDITINWEMIPKPGSTLVTVLHPSRTKLFSAQAFKMAVIFNETDIAKRVTDTQYTDTSIGLIQFKLTGITVEDAGYYIARYPGPLLIAKDRLGEMLVVYMQPSNPTLIDNFSPVVEGNMVLSCLVESNSKPDGHDLQMKYIWYRDGVVLPVEDRYNISGSQLQIKDIQKTDSRTVFNCKAYETVSIPSNISNDYIMHCEYGPDTVSPDSRQQLSILENMDSLGPITCSADCVPPCAYQWKFKGADFGSSGDTLILHNIQVYSSGVYWCIAWNIHGTSRSSDVEVSVQHGDMLNNVFQSFMFMINLAFCRGTCTSEK